MSIIGRYDLVRNIWLYGYWKDTRFFIMDWFNG